MKKIVLLIAILCLLQITKAQKNQNVYFFKNSGKEVQIKDSADYVRIIQELDSGETNFNLLEFYFKVEEFEIKVRWFLTTLSVLPV